MKFSIKDLFSKCTEEILNGKLHFLCSDKELKDKVIEVLSDTDVCVTSNEKLSQKKISTIATSFLVQEIPRLSLMKT